MAKVRNPVCTVRVNDSMALLPDGVTVGSNSNAVLTGVMEAEVVNTNFYSADTFRVVVALKQAPPWFDVDYISSQAAIPLEVIMGPTPADTLSLIQGLVDDVDYDPVENTVELRGRDYTRYFIDTKTTQKWVSKTVADVVTVLAGKYGLSVQSGPRGLPQNTVGSYLGQYQSKVGDGRTEWDLLTMLSGKIVDEGGSSYVTYVSGKTLYFGPRPQAVNYTLSCYREAAATAFQVLPAADPSAGPAWGANSLSFSRNVSVLRNVVVRMYSQQHGAATLAATYPPQFSSLQPDAASAQPLYLFNAGPNVTQDALALQAQARQQDISRHEVRVSAKFPGDSVLSQASLLQVSGVADSFDQTYFIQSVTRHFSPSGGYVMECSGQNRADSGGGAS